jgi:putative effector of murein hydrolase
MIPDHDPLSHLRRLQQMILSVPLWAKRRLTSLPAWVIVLGTAAVIGSISATVSVMGLARYQNRNSPAIAVPITDTETVEGGETLESDMR